MSKKRGRQNTISLPPRLPQTGEELERFITLLGNRKQAELNPSARDELRELLGVYPTVKEAAPWKSMLRRICSEVVRSRNKAHGSERGVE
jgi:hypothetical protein